MANEILEMMKKRQQTISKNGTESRTLNTNIRKKWKKAKKRKKVND